MNQIYASKHQLNAVQARIDFFYQLAFKPSSVFQELKRLERMEEALIRAVDADRKKCA